MAPETQRLASRTPSTIYRTIAAALCALTATAALGGCELIVRFDESRLDTGVDAAPETSAPTDASPTDAPAADATSDAAADAPPGDAGPADATLDGSPDAAPVDAASDSAPESG